MHQNYFQFKVLQLKILNVTLSECQIHVHFSREQETQEAKNHYEAKCNEKERV